MPETKCGFEDSPGVLGRDLLVSQGPTLIVDIGFDPTFTPTNIGNVPASGIKGVQALVDTGAVESCIDGGLAMQLNLPIVDRRIISGSAGRHEVNVHLAQIHVPSLMFTIYGTFSAVDLVAGGQPHYALIGRTFLQTCKMSYDGTTGQVIISR